MFRSYKELVVSVYICDIRLNSLYSIFPHLKINISSVNPKGVEVTIRGAENPVVPRLGPTLLPCRFCVTF